MIEQILITSCEHQSYRRGAGLAFFEYFGYDLNIIDIVWGLHGDYYSAEEINTAMESIIGRPFEDAYQFPHDISCHEAYLRGIQTVINTNKNTILMEDDHYLIVPAKELNNKLENLDRIAKTMDRKIGVVQLHTVGNHNGQPEIPIPGAEDFCFGSTRGSRTANFWTPHGAALYMEAMLSGRSGSVNPENDLPLRLYAEPWVFSIYNPDDTGGHIGKFVFRNKWLDGDSLGYRFTKEGIEKRRSPERMAQNEMILEKFKL